MRFRKTLAFLTALTSAVCVYGGFMPYSSRNSSNPAVISAHAEDWDSNARYDIEKDADGNSIMRVSGSGWLRNSTKPAPDSEIRSIIIEEGITAIEREVFMGYENLESVVLPESLEKIGGNAFADCPALKDIELPERVEFVGDGAFNNTADYNSQSGGVAVIGNWAVGLCADTDISSLSELVIPDGVVGIASGAFNAELSGTEKLSLPESLKYICDSAFRSIPNLEQLSLPETNPLTIGISAFGNSCLPSLTSLTLPANVVSVGEHAFSGAEALESLTVSDGVKEISGFAFANCSSLSEISLPDSLGSVGYSAFSGSKYISDREADGEPVIFAGKWIISTNSSQGETSLAGAVGIADRALENLNTEKIVIPATVKSYGKSVTYMNDTVKIIEFEDGSEKVGPHMFTQCTGIEKVLLPESVKETGIESFRGCTALAEIDLENLEIIDSGSFADCPSLKEIRFSNSLIEIGEDGFNMGDFAPSADRVVLPESLEKLGRNAFYSAEYYQNIGIRSMDCEIDSDPGTLHAKNIYYCPESTAETYVQSLSDENITAVEYISGDVTKDSAIRAGDASVLLFASENSWELSNMAREMYFDYNGNGEVDNDDAQQVIKKAVGNLVTGFADSATATEGYKIEINADTPAKNRLKISLISTGETFSAGDFIVNFDSSLKISNSDIKIMTELGAVETDENSVYIACADSKNMEQNSVIAEMTFTLPNDATGKTFSFGLSKKPYVVKINPLQDGNNLSYESHYVDIGNALEVTVPDGAVTPPKLGDTDNDGMIDASDASSILAMYANLSTGQATASEADFACMDVDGDNMIDASDASLVLSYYAYVSTGGDAELEEYLKNN